MRTQNKDFKSKSWQMAWILQAGWWFEINIFVSFYNVIINFKCLKKDKVKRRGQRLQLARWPARGLCSNWARPAAHDRLELLHVQCFLTFHKMRGFAMDHTNSNLVFTPCNDGNKLTSHASSKEGCVSSKLCEKSLFEQLWNKISYILKYQTARADFL